jgi:molybdate transport system permease protein
VSALWLSLFIASTATACVAAVGVPLAYVMARSRFFGRSAVETLLTLPLVLPPTVVGYGLVLLLGAQGVLGRWLHRAFDYSLLFRIEAAVLAAGIVSFPLLYLPAKAAFRAVDPEMYETAALLGASRWQTFLHVSLPMAAGGIFSGAVLCFARALGEFGATVMVFGWQPGRMTMPIAVYSAYEQGELWRGMPMVAGLTLICLLLLVLINRRGES